MRVAFLIGCCAGLCPGADSTVAGEVRAPSPTLTNLSIEWMIEGDDNLNGSVNVHYRVVGERAWRQGMPLRRVPAGEARTTAVPFGWANKHSGSIFDLRPNTEYEVRLTLSDPDGGSATRMIRARTRPVPRASPHGVIRRVTPETIARAAAPGEILLLVAGQYGRFVAPSDGEPGRPIIYRSSDGAAIFDSIVLDGRKHVYVEGLTIRTQVGAANPRGVGITLRGCVECVVRRCRIDAVYGIRASSPPGCTNCYIADNIIEGTTPWTPEAMGANGKNIGEGIELAGSGNVIAFNRVKGFRDCISTMEDRNAHDQFSIDILNNDIYTGADDAVEADFCLHNCRVMRNRITNSFVGVSSQPGLGGPTYFIRNVMYNLTYVPFKLHRYSQGDVILHNTTVKVGDGMACFAGQPFDFAYFRNNLSIGGPPGGIRWGGYGGGTGLAANFVSPGPHTDFDYDAVGTWETPFAARIGRRDFFDVERHGVRIDMSVFDPQVEFPNPPLPERAPPDLRPRRGSKVENAAVRIPNVNDRYLGNGPDIGAYEVSQPLPTYGPRPEAEDEETVLAALDRASKPIRAERERR
ncbi:MAG TPA: right-handed parallel beta-helix repeat-containing protein [Bryobacteraceae bacterium]|nr:right-handed parallel beta-helix repeat-containing protein [Bryobacteraceae bacterium]